MKSLGQLGGRKFVSLWLAVGVLLLFHFLDKPIPPEVMELLTYGLPTYLLGQGVADGLSKGKTSSTAEMDQPEKKGTQES